MSKMENKNLNASKWEFLAHFILRCWSLILEFYFEKGNRKSKNNEQAKVYKIRNLENSLSPKRI
jgi:hypothetical protein